MAPILNDVREILKCPRMAADALCDAHNMLDGGLATLATLEAGGAKRRGQVDELAGARTKGEEGVLAESVVRGKEKAVIKDSGTIRTKGTGKGNGKGKGKGKGTGTRTDGAKRGSRRRAGQTRRNIELARKKVYYFASWADSLPPHAMALIQADFTDRAAAEQPQSVPGAEGGEGGALRIVSDRLKAGPAHGRPLVTPVAPT